MKPITPKYELGQQLYMIRERNRKFDTITKSYYGTWIVLSMKPKEINIHIRPKYTRIYYRSNVWVEEKDIYENRKDAKAECAKLNVINELRK